jgi:predicted RND superfamily exporter protein
VPEKALRVGGDVVVNALIDIESRAAIDQLTGYAMIVAVLMALLALRSLRLTIMVLVVSGYSAAVAYATVYFAGGEMNLILVVMPVLVYVLAIEGSLHLVNYYRAAVQSSGERGAPVRALRAGWLPCTLAAATTAVGLLSLGISHLEPVRAFGRFGALGVMVTLLFLFLLMPLLLERYPSRSSLQGSDVGERPPARHNRFIAWMARRVVRHRRAWVLLTMVVVASLGAGLRQTSTSVSAVRFFPQDHDIVRDIQWLEDHIGPLVPVEIVVQFDNRQNRLTMVRRMELVRDLRDAVASASGVGSVIAASTLAPPLPREGGKQGDAATPPAGLLSGESVSALRRALLNAGLRGNRDQFVRWGYLSQQGAEDGDEVEYWRITARFSAVSEQPYDHFVADVRQRVESTIAAASAEARSGVSAFYTGTVPLIHVAQRELLDGLFKSFLMAFALIALTMAALFRSIGAGLVSMIPNVCPAILVFGGMGWIGKSIDVGAMLTASVAMGIAVDGTLHYVTWYRAAIAHGLTRPAAITHAYERCVGALVQSTAITGLALLVYATSTFEPVSQFGLLMCLMLTAALLGNAVLLPAVMSTRVGRLFAARPKAGEAAAA